MDIARRYRIAVCLKISEYLQAKKKPAMRAFLMLS